MDHIAAQESLDARRRAREEESARRNEYLGGEERIAQRIVELLQQEKLKPKPEPVRRYRDRYRGYGIDGYWGW